MDEFGLHSQSNISSEPDFLYTKFCLMQIVTLSSGRGAASQINLWTVLSSCDHFGLFLTACIFVY